MSDQQSNNHIPMASKMPKEGEANLNKLTKKQHLHHGSDHLDTGDHHPNYPEGISQAASSMLS